MSNSKKMIRKILLSLTFINICMAVPPINFFRPYNILLYPTKWPDSRMQFRIDDEFSLDSRAFRFEKNDCNEDVKRKTNVLHIWQKEQDACIVLKNCDPESDIGQLSQLCNINGNNGTHSIFNFCGDLKLKTNLLMQFRYNFNHNFSLGIFLPFIQMELQNVCIQEIKNEFDFEANLSSACDLLNLFACESKMNFGSWKRQGVGDLVVQAIWMRDFPQAKPFLKNVKLNARFGPTIPTGLRQDEDKLLAIPFGNDGAFGFVFGLGMELSFANYLRAGLDAEFMQLFGNTRNRRIKTVIGESDLILMHKVKTYKTWGFTNLFTLYLDAVNFCHGLSVRFAYQFQQHDKDKVFPCSDTINPLIANNAVSLFEWTTHSAIINVKYDFTYDRCTSIYSPALYFFYKWGFNGTRAILLDTLTFGLSINF